MLKTAIKYVKMAIKFLPFVLGALVALSNDPEEEKSSSISSPENMN